MQLPIALNEYKMVEPFPLAVMAEEEFVAYF